MKEIPLSRGKVALVDDEDFECVNAFSWHVNSNGYVRAYKRDGVRRYRKLSMHRFIIGLSLGDGQVVDHINGDRLDNRRCNLRICTKSQNGCNRGANINNKSGFKGVSFDTKANRFRAKIQVHGKSKHLGYFESPDAAYAAYCAAVGDMHGDFANPGVNHVLG